MEEDLRYYSGIDEVEMTDDLINQIVEDGFWGDVESLKKLRDDGGKWNTKRHSVTFPPEIIE